MSMIIYIALAGGIALAALAVIGFLIVTKGNDKDDPYDDQYHA